MDNSINKINESFTDVFDSDLTDYSKGFEEDDKQYRIKHWLEEHVEFTHPIKTAFGDDINGDWSSHGDYVINDDYTISVYADMAIAFDDDGALPEYIKFRESQGSIELIGGKSMKNLPVVVWGGFMATNYCGKSLEGCPKIVVGMLCPTPNSCAINITNCIDGYSGSANLEGLPIFVTGLKLICRKSYTCTDKDIDCFPKYLGGTISGYDSFSMNDCLNFNINSMKDSMYGARRSDWPNIKEHMKNYIKEAQKRYFNSAIENERHAKQWPEVYNVIKNENINCYGFSDFKLKPISFDKYKNKVNEDFSNVFDTDLVDYSGGFEKTDKELLKDKIATWLTLFISPNSKADVYTYYTINDDCTVSLNSNCTLYPNAKEGLDKKFSLRSVNGSLDFTYYLTSYTSLNEKLANNIKDLITSKSNGSVDEALFCLTYFTYDSEFNIAQKHYGTNSYEAHNLIPDFINITDCHGDFTVKSTTGLRSLRGLPKKIYGSFYIDNLKSLSFEDGWTGGPEYVKNNVSAEKCQLTTLKGFPTRVDGNIFLKHNMLKSLDGLPSTIQGDLDCYDNKLPNLKGTAKTVWGSIYADGQKPDYDEIINSYRRTNNISMYDEIDNDVRKEVLSRILGPKGIRFFGVMLRFGFEDPKSGYWEFKTNSTSETTGEASLVKGEENSSMLCGIHWWDPVHKVGKPMRLAEPIKDTLRRQHEELNEGISDAFDSDLVDYSNNYEESDKKYIQEKYAVLKYIQEYILKYGFDKQHWSWHKNNVKVFGGKPTMLLDAYTCLKENEPVKINFDNNPIIESVNLWQTLRQLGLYQNDRSDIYYDIDCATNCKEIANKYPSAKDLTVERYKKIIDEWVDSLSDIAKSICQIRYEICWNVDSMSYLKSIDNKLWFTYEIWGKSKSAENSISEYDWECVFNGSKTKDYKIFNKPKFYRAPQHSFGYGNPYLDPWTKKIADEYKSEYNDMKKSLEYAEKVSMKKLLELLKLSDNDINQFNVMNESFSDAFDSDLTDYSSDFAEQDKKYYAIKNLVKFYNNASVIVKGNVINIEPIYWSKTIDLEYTKDYVNHINLIKSLGYSINKVCGSLRIIDVKDFTDFSAGGIPKIVTDNFECDYFDSLTSLKGGPEKVGRDFSCHFCDSLTSLEGAPKEVGRDFICNNCKSLTSLKGAPKKVGSDFYCSCCKSLTSLKGAPKDIAGSFYCNRCISLTSLEGGPEKVGEDFDCTNCKSLTSLEGAPKEVGRDFNCTNCRKLKSLKGLSPIIGGKLKCSKNISMNEGFSDAFDSSLTDYSKDFEDSDIEAYRESLKQEVCKFYSGIKPDNVKIDDNGLMTITTIDSMGCWPGTTALTYTQTYKDWIIKNKKYFTIYKVDGNLSISTKCMELYDGIPEIVTGSCAINENSELISLKGCPKEVGKNFSCRHCNRLKSLKGGPEKVGRDFYCSDCTSLTSLEGSPKEVSGDFFCSGCNNLINLQGMSQNIGRGIRVSGCKQLESLEGSPMNVNGEFLCNGCNNLLSLKGGPRTVRYGFSCERCNSLTSLEGGPEEVGGYYNCSDCNKLTSIEGRPKKLGGDFTCYPQFNNVSNNETYLDEGFSDAFDSSLTDYSKDFEEQDKKALIKHSIIVWMSLGFIENNSGNPQVKYKINESDMSIDLLNSKSDSMVKNVHGFRLKDFREFKLRTLDGSIYHYTDLCDYNNNPLPLDRLPDFINIRTTNGFDWNCGYCGLTTLKGCPTTVEGGSYCCAHNNLSNFDYLPNKGKIHDLDVRDQKNNTDNIDFSNIMTLIDNKIVNSYDVHADYKK